MVQSESMFCVLKGSEGFESQINRCLDNAEYLYDKLKGRADFQLVLKSKVSLVLSTAAFYPLLKHCKCVRVHDKKNLIGTFLF